MTTLSTTVTLGRTGLEVSPICYGSWQASPKFWGDLPEDQLIAAMRKAVELGINFFDTADAYGDGYAERIMGKALASFPRDSLIVATKVYWHIYDDGRRHPDLSHDYILAACDASLQRLGMDYIDLYQCHAWDPLTPVAETVAALETLKRQGKIRHYGVSNWTAEQIRTGHAAGGDFATHQPPYSLIHRGIEADVLPYCQAQDMGVLVYSPLHRGLLTGKYTGQETFTDHRADLPEFQGERFRTLCDRVKAIEPIARDYSLSTVQLVLAVTMMHPAIHCAIAGIKRPSDITDAAAAMGKTISREDYHRVRALLRA